MKEAQIMTLGEKLSKLRKEYNYTQEQLAEVLGVSRQSVSKWESDIAYPETDKLIRIGKIFECSMDYLLKDEIVETTGESNTFVTEKLEKIKTQIITDSNKQKAKKIAKILGIMLITIFSVDFISMILYFFICGFPK